MAFSRRRPLMRKRRRKHETLAGLRRDFLIGAAVNGGTATLSLIVIGVLALHPL